MEHVAGKARSRAARLAWSLCCGLLVAPNISCDGALAARNTPPAAPRDSGAEAQASAGRVVLLPRGHTIADVAEKVTPSV